MNATSTNDQREYRTPLRWLVQVLKKSRDNWKVKYNGLQDRIKAMRTRIRDLERSRRSWREKAEALQLEIDALKKSPTQSQR